MEQPRRDSHFDKCACGGNKHKGRERCYRCHAKWRYANDPKYKAIKNRRADNNDKGECPRCGGVRLLKAKLCDDCAQVSIKGDGPIEPQMSYADCAMVYSYLNPDDPITRQHAKTAIQTAMVKIRKAIAAEGTHEERIALAAGLKEFLDG